MGALETIGCLLIAFAPALSVFVVVVAPDPLRIILFVLGAFFWLLSLLISSLFWLLVIPLQDTLEFGLCFSVAFQELFRLLYFYLLKFAEKGLDKLGENGGMQIAGVHSLKKSRHTISMVCGLGMGVVSGLFMLVNVAADFSGDGTAGLPSSVRVANYTVQTKGHGDYTFFLMSSIGTSALVMLHCAWTVIFWDGLSGFKPLIQTTTDENTEFVATNSRRNMAMAAGQVALVVVTHYVASLVTLLNRQHLYAWTLGVQYLLLFGLSAVSYRVSGGVVGVRRSPVAGDAGNGGQETVMNLGSQATDQQRDLVTDADNVLTHRSAATVET